MIIINYNNDHNTASPPKVPSQSYVLFVVKGIVIVISCRWPVSGFRGHDCAIISGTVRIKSESNYSGTFKLGSGPLSN